MKKQLPAKQGQLLFILIALLAKMLLEMDSKEKDTRSGE